MEVAQFHRAFWDYKSNTGIGKIHYQALGIIAFVFEDEIPKFDTNFLDDDEVNYYRNKYKKADRILSIGVQIDRDVDLVHVRKAGDYFVFEELNLEIRLESPSRYFRATGNQEWILIENAPLVEYKRCDSLICVS